ncbi:DUF7507 domain-containing protein [Glaciihabitans arcticus]|uniref:DUF7507 domain-containing protein n=1 Tax=Glaciihabitans arcticus TaxID=2668039 RepID=UPI00195C086E|nr:DUF11 domain-containing protein [Glaciihabitans arcticus]
MHGTPDAGSRRAHAPRFRRALALVVSIGVVVSGLTLAPAQQASAAVVQWGTNSGTTPNYQATVNGDFVQAGNGVLSCTGAALATGAGTCTNLHAAADPATANVNDNFAMVNSNTIAGFTTNSSSAKLTIPSGANVVKAFLTWSGNTGVFTGDSRMLCTTFSTSRGVATLPTGSAVGYRTRAAQLQVAGGPVTNVAPTSMLEDPASQATALYYSASADVTSAFGVGTGQPITVSAGNIWGPTGAGCYAGWGLTVVYDYGTYIPGNINSVPHRVIYYEGHVRQGQNDADLTVGFTGFTAVETGTRAGFTLFEGDRNIVGDSAEYSRSGTTYTELNNSAGVTNNFGIGRAIGSDRYTQTADTSAFTNQSVDVATIGLANVVQGDSSVNLRLGTSGDSYLLRNAILSVPTAGLQVNKSYNGTADVQARTAAEKATFTVVITNTGAGTLRNIVVTDDQSDCARTLTGVVLTPLQTTTYTCTATAASAGTYVSTANATGYTLVGNYLANDSDSTTINLSSIALAKTSALPAGSIGRVGDVLTYTFTITNNGSSPLTGVTVTDPLADLSALTYSWPTATAGALAAGAIATATATYTLKQADVNAGSIVNTATTTGTDSDGGIKPTATATRTTTIAPVSTIAVTKTGALVSPGTGRVGDVIRYSFGFTNTGNVTLTNVVLNDPLADLSTPVVTWPGTAGTLLPGATATATANYTIKQADVNAGSVKNTATVTSRTPAGATTTGTSPQASIPTVAAAPAMTTTKTGVASGNAGPGQTITYTFTVRNTGNVTLTDVVLTDPLATLSAITVTGGTGSLTSLAPNQTVIATATYTIKQADVDAGSVRNIATATSKAPNGATVSAVSTQSVVPTLAASPAITLAKSGTLPAGAANKAGDVVTYTFTLTNSGNVTLTAASITDPLQDLSAITVTGGTGTLANLSPGQTVIARATYTLKQSDVDAGSVANTATASAKPPTGANVTRTTPATVAIVPAGSLSVVKNASPATGLTAGATVNYSFVVKNEGNVTLSQVTLSDPLPSLGTITVTWPTPANPGVLTPGQTATATASYTVKQSDVDAGSIRNTASATGRTPSGTTVTGSSADRVVTTIAAAPALATTKTATIAGGAAGNAGDVINYAFRTTNSGNVTVTGVTINDPLQGLSALSYTWPGAVGVLAPGQFVTATATYVIKQADVNSGRVINTATGTGSYGATALTSSSGPITRNTAAPNPSIVTTKSGALATGATGRAGETVNWTITLRNSGNVTLTAVTVADSLPGITAPVYGTWPSGVANTLQPGQTVTATASYVLTQDDVNSGSVPNVATGRGTPPTGAAVTSTDSATVPLASGPALTIAKTGAVTSGNGSVGDTITFSFVVRNTGNVTLNSVGISDTLAGLSGLSYTWPVPASPNRLQPNTQATATATYVIKQADVNAGTVRNTATASGTPPTGPAVTATSAVASVATASAAPALTTTKTASPSTALTAGTTVTYTLTARNTGNVTLTGVTFAETLPDISVITVTGGTGTPASLAPGQTVIAQATYVVKQSDVDSGSVRNTASSTANFGATSVTGTTGQVVTPTVAAAPAISLSKTGTLQAGAKAGDSISYAFVVRNTGNVTLRNVTLTDPLQDLSAITVTGGTGTLATLLPNQTVTASASYVLKQSDVDAGAVANTARATGTPPTGAAVSVTTPNSVSVAPTGTLTVLKTGAVTTGTGIAGDIVTFSFTIRNTGNVTLSGVTLTDSLAGLSIPALTWQGGTTGVLAPNATATGTATYVIKQADVDSGSIANTATVTGKTPTGQTVPTATSSVTVPTATADRRITVSQTASILTGAKVGDVVSYTITITNPGNQTLTGVTLTDTLVGLTTPNITWPGAAGTLLPNGIATATATYTVTQADVDAGSFSNRASVTSTAPGNATVADTSAVLTTTTIAPVRTLSLAKSGTLPSGSSARVGDIVSYTFVLRNTGNVTVTGAGITDPLQDLSAITFAPGAWPTATAGTLPPLAQVTGTANYTLKQSDIDSGSLANTATGTATPPTGPVITATGLSTLPLASGPALTVTKAGSTVAGANSVNDTVTFSFVVRNTGNVTLTSVGISDTLAGLSTISYGTWPSGTTGRLLPNTQVLASATYVIKQADVNAGSVRNTATASGTPPTGPVVTATSTEAVVPTVAASSSMIVTKNATGSGGNVGDVITYSIVARNTGNVTLTGVTLNDPLLGIQTASLVWSNQPNVLQPQETVSTTATYVIQQADVDAGQVANTATATGVRPGGTVLEAQSTRVVTPTAPASPRLFLTKVAALPTGGNGSAGELVTWTIRITNTGNVTLSGIDLTDSLPGISPAAFGVWPGAPNVLAPNQEVLATATYVLGQSDIDSGALSNSATATGNPPTGAPTSFTGSGTLPLSTTSTLTLSKTAAYVGAGTGAVGDTIRYTFVARNTGKVTLTGVTISDPRPNLGAISYGSWPGAVGTLLPNQEITATADYVVRQIDVNTGSVTNTASVSGKPPTGPNTTASSQSVTVDTIARTASILATKTFTISGTGTGLVGEVITYTVSARNTGTVTLTGVSLSDTAPGLTPLVYGPWPGGVANTLQPNTPAVTATTTHVITQADVNAGSISNVATAAATSQVTPIVTNSTAPVVTDTVAADARYTFTKVGTPAAGFTGKAGDRITYTLTATNTGNQTLTGVTLTDPLINGVPIVISWPTPASPGVLQPGQVATGTADYTLIQSDVDSGSVINEASSTAVSPRNGPLARTAASTVPLAATPGISIVKTAVANGNRAVGDSIDYTVIVRNTGNVTLTGVTITDSLAGLPALSITWPGTPGVLPPNSSATGTASYVLTQANIDNQSVTNVASVTATPPAGAPAVTATSDPVVTSTAAVRGELRVVKTGTVLGGGIAGVGSVIRYLFTVTNTGNVTLTGATLSDQMLGAATPALGATTLAPQAVTTATVDYTVTQADVNAGSVINTATASATEPGNITITSPASTSTTATAASNPSILVDKTATTGATKAGDVVTWTFVVRNTGNVTLTAINLVDGLPGATPVIVPANTTLDPGAEFTVQSTSTVTQADVNAGALINTVTATGSPARGADATSSDSVTVPLVPDAGVSLTKTASPTSGLFVGDVVTYSFVARNTGNVTLTGVAISDALTNLTGIVYTNWNGNPAGTLQPNTEVIATATYVVTQRDVDAGSISSVATVRGTPPVGADVTDTDDATVTTIAADPSLFTTKTASSVAKPGVGQVITYTITVVNDGNVTLKDVAITDSLVGLSDLNYQAWPGGIERALGPDESITATATYVVTQNDVNSGSVTNTATAAGTTFIGTTPASDTSDPAVTPTIDRVVNYTFDKSGALESGALGEDGDIIEYVLTLTNTGNVSLTDVHFADTLIGLTPLQYTWPTTAPAGTLLPGATVTATTTFEVDQPNVDAGSVVNVGSGLVTPIGTAAEESKTDSVTVNIAPRGRLVAVKTGVLRSPGIGQVGDLIDYKVVVTNTGNVTVTNGRLVDPLPGISTPVIGWPGTPGTLPVGASVTGTATYPLTQADIDRGYIDNTAKVDARSPNSAVNDVAASSNTVRIDTVAPRDALGVTKTAIAGDRNVGDQITYNLIVRNTGNTTLTGVTLSDPLLGADLDALPWDNATNPNHNLPPNATIATQGRYTITQADVNAGFVRNVATAAGSSLVGARPATGTSGNVDTPTADADPGISVTKTGTAASTRVGGVVTYSFTIENTGNVRLSAVDLVDAMPGLYDLVFTAWNNGPLADGSLDPDDTATATAKYDLLQSDVNAGSVVNTVTAVGTPPRGAVARATAAATVPIVSGPDLRVSKTGSLNGAPGELNDFITYSFEIENTGNVTLSAVALTDSLAGVSAPVITWPGTARVLAPGAIATATATYRIQQTDVDFGSVSNVATATATTPAGATYSEDSPAAVTQTATRTRAIDVRKIDTRDGAGGVGDVIRYSIEIENTGNTTLTAVTLTDTMPGLTLSATTWPGATGTLLPGDIARAQGNYTIVQADVDNGSVTNQASVDGTSPIGAVSDETGPVTTPTAVPARTIQVTQTAELAPGATGRALDQVDYTFTLKNTGNQTLTGVTLTDPLVDFAGAVYTWPASDGVLLPGETVTVTVPYLLTQANVDNGSVSSTVTGSAQPPTGAALTQAVTVVLTIPPITKLSPVKSARILNNGTGAVGDVIEYTLRITNDGNVTMYDGLLVDPMIGLGTPVITWPIAGQPRVLPPGTFVTGVAEYTIKQSDVDTGRVTNTAHVSAKTPKGVLVSADSNTVVVPTVLEAPVIVATAVGTPRGTAGVGDVIDYEFRISNPGNVTLHGVTLVDAVTGVVLADVTWPNPARPGEIAPGTFARASGTYVITLDDVNAGAVTNPVTATGLSPSPTNTLVTDDDVSTIPTQAIGPNLAITKTAAFATAGRQDVGSTVNWSYLLTNTGNVTLTGAQLVDELGGISAISYDDWDGTAFTLKPGESVQASATSALTLAQLNAGRVESAATGSGTPPRGVDVTRSTTAGIDIPASPALTVAKAGVPRAGGGLGDIVDYTFTIRNTGNVTLTLLEVIDGLADISAVSYQWNGGPVGVIEPGSTIVATAEYTVKQSDVDSGQILNQATASGKPPVGPRVSGSSPIATTTLAPEDPELVVTKVATPPAVASVGAVVSYDFTITNTGTVTLHGIVLSDSLQGVEVSNVRWPGDEGVLAPNAVATATATFAIRQADVNAGSVINTASASGLTPKNVRTSSQDAVATVTTATANPVITVTKTGALAAGSTGRVGELVNFAFSLRNDGNQTLTNVRFVDQKAGVSTIQYDRAGFPGGTLQPGETITGTATYPLTQPEIDAATVSNSVRGYATPPTGVEFFQTATVNVPVVQSPDLTAFKTGVLRAGGIGQVGDWVDYKLVPTNTGNVTLYDGELTDALEGLTDPVITWPNPADEGTVAPGESATGVASYQLRQVDIDNGFMENTATVRAFTLGGTEIPATSNTVRINTVQAQPAVSVVKTGVATGSAGANDTIAYSFLIRNTGNVTIGSIAVNDPKLPAGGQPVIQWPGASRVLAPNVTVAATAIYDISQADVNAGNVINTATVSATPVRGLAVSATSNTSTVATEVAAPTVAVTNNGVRIGGATARAGDTVEWTYVFTNTGNVTLSGSSITDGIGALPAGDYSWSSGTPGVLGPADTATVIRTQVLTQADIDAGSVSSVATGRGLPPTGAAASATAPATVQLMGSPLLAISKTGAPAIPAQLGLGDALSYEVVLTNTGNTTLTGVTLGDALQGIVVTSTDWPDADGVLLPGDSVTYELSYTVQQEDVDRGSVDNVATATATSPAGAVGPVQSGTVSIDLEAHDPGIAVVKSGQLLTGTGDAGSVIQYEFDVTNTGNVTLRLVEVTDALPGVSTPVLTFPSTSNILAPGGVAHGTARYTVTRADVDNGTIRNTATAFGTTPDDVIINAPSAPFDISTSAARGELFTSHTAALAAGATGVLGNTMNYTFTLRNDGNVRVENVAMTNTVAGLGNFVYTWPDPVNPGRLLAGESAQVTATRTVSQADVDLGVVRNVTTATGEAARGPLNVSDTSPQTSVPLAAGASSMTVLKEGVVRGGGAPVVGSIIDYTFTATNTGSLTLTDPVFSDTKPGLSAIGGYTWPTATAGVVPPGQSATAAATYTVRQSDFDGGEVRNVASASATPSRGAAAVSGTSTPSVIPTAGGASSINIDKTQLLAAAATGRAGDAVLFRWEVTNTGTHTLTGVTVADPQVPASAISYAFPGAAGVLAPNGVVIATATYILSQADVDAGRIASTATTTGTPPTGTNVTDAEAGETLITAAPAMTVTKTSSAASFAQQGATLDYRIEVRNTGNVTLTGVTVSDVKPGLSALTYVWPGTPGTLRPNGLLVVTARYTITAADVASGTIDNTATANANAPGGSALTPVADTDTFAVPRVADIGITVSPKVRAGQAGFAGDTVVVSYVVRNNGTEPLNNVEITDPRTGLSTIVYGAWPGAVGVLLPGESVTATATYTITAAMEGQRLTETASVTSIDVNNGDPVLANAVGAVQLPVRAIDPGGLIKTGTDAEYPLGASLLLLLSGLGLILIARRRQRKAAS